MAETLGSLCDKLTVVKLKQYHSQDPERLRSLQTQQEQIQEEINDFVAQARTGQIAVERLTFAANKVFKSQGNTVEAVIGSIGEIFSTLAQTNCELWHEQEKVYDFEAVPLEEKNGVVKQLALLNLKRNQCIDQIDRQLRAAIETLPTS